MSIINSFTKTVFCRFEIYTYLQLRVSLGTKENLNLAKSAFSSQQLYILSTKLVTSEILWVTSERIFVSFQFENYRLNFLKNQMNFADLFNKI